MKKRPYENGDRKNKPSKEEYKDEEEYKETELLEDETFLMDDNDVDQTDMDQTDMDQTETEFLDEKLVFKLQTGEILEDRYKVVKLLGSGGMGRVYLAENVRIGNYWAIKEISRQDSNFLGFMAEPEMLKRLQHPRLPRIVDIIESDDNIYIVEDYFKGKTLKELIEQKGTCYEQEVLKWGKELCDILIYLHGLEPEPIIYQDMKPSNIIIDENGETKLIDFGISKAFTQKKDKFSFGSRGYAAPEQYNLDVITDKRADIYGLGATLYCALTGYSPSSLC